ncbi:hypothetical protein KW796_01135 [Candidatus Parcubacteria bacterium]|nr:hypothetical protein [Candidatus Parcubacteria bacterium]
MASAHAEYNWLRSRAMDTQGKAGLLYECLMAEALGCEISERGKAEYADIYSERLGIRVEIKARGDNNPHGFRVDQILHYEWDLPAELRHTLYAVVLYRSRRAIRKGEAPPNGFSTKTTMVSMLRFLKTDEQRNQFWAENVTVVYLLDLRVINGLESLLGTVKGHFAGRPDEMDLVVNRTVLTELFQDASLTSSLKKLHLSPSGWAKGVYPMKVRFQCPIMDPDVSGRVIRHQTLDSGFTMITLVRRNLHAQLAQEISARTLALV